MLEKGKSVTADSRAIRRSDRAVHRELADNAGGVLLHLDTSAYYSLNAVGLLIWNLLEDGPTFPELVDRLRIQIRDAPPELEADVREFLDELRQRELITIENR
jgi:predicted Rdx family selenoprotein